MYARTAKRHVDMSKADVLIPHNESAMITDENYRKVRQEFFKLRSQCTRFAVGYTLVTTSSSSRPALVKFAYCVVGETVAPYRVQFADCCSDFVESRRTAARTCVDEIHKVCDSEPNFLA